MRGAVIRHNQLLPKHAGTLGVVRTQPLSPVPYTSTVRIESGEIAEDLTQYLAQSEQTNSAMALGVQLDSSGRVTAAGGYLVQVRFVQGCAFHEFSTITALPALFVGYRANT